MIRLEHLTKEYPNQPAPAVRDLSLDIQRGEIVILVGPSGCGKTTTLKMINRIIEPTSGRIFLQGEDVTTVDANKLRRRIGYVIQQVGLYPHMTIAQNIGVVPKMLGWDKKRIAGRVDELLRLVGLDPEIYRGRYPKQLSGGQQQRVGVARALGADPPVMLMDEPFGAIDPIARESLQNEFLSVQEEVRKTIVFVTHDIDEAIKMGDRIAILRVGSDVAQYDTPENILANPADEFVEDFIGAGATVKRLTLTRVGDVAVAPWPTVGAGDDPDDLLAAARRADVADLLMLDEQRRPVGWLPTDVKRTDTSLLAHGLPVLSPIGPRETLFDALDAMLKASSTVAVTVDGDGVYRGTLGLDRIRELIHADGGDGRAAGREAEEGVRRGGRSR